MLPPLIPVAIREVEMGDHVRSWDAAFADEELAAILAQKPMSFPPIVDRDPGDETDSEE